MARIQLNYHQPYYVVWSSAAAVQVCLNDLIFPAIAGSRGVTQIFASYVALWLVRNGGADLIFLIVWQARKKDP
ncbi:hypothetical protein F5883DRAFT_176916 [Diaporthe sp. PMI_573]|nr:hypothetical protein F5883DRAFT_176916 [Diaporthaceae sp. PMI_573]